MFLQAEHHSANKRAGRGALVPDVVGYRAKIGVIVPSTNTVVEHDFARVRPPGVTFHSGRFLVEAPDLSSDVVGFDAHLDGDRHADPHRCFHQWLR